MLRIGVVSDTHGSFQNAAKAIKVLGDIDYLFHAGDGKNDAIALGKLAGCPVFSVCGNTDGAVEPLEELIDLQELEGEEYSGVKILLIHGFQFAPSSREMRLADYAKSKKAVAVVYGHTHKPYLSYHSGILVFNPGSPTRPRGSKSSCGLLEVVEKKIFAKIVEIP